MSEIILSDHFSEFKKNSEKLEKKKEDQIKNEMIYYNEFLKSRKSHTQWRNTEAPANILLLLSKRTAERMLNRCLQAGEYVPPLRWRGAPEALTHEQTLSVVKRCHLLIQTYGLLTSRMITGEALDVARQPLPNETKAQTFSRWNRCGGKDWRKDSNKTGDL